MKYTIEVYHLAVAIGCYILINGAGSHDINFNRSVATMWWLVIIFIILCTN